MERYRIIELSVHTALILPLISFIFANFMKHRVSKCFVVWITALMLVGAAVVFDFGFYQLYQYLNFEDISAVGVNFLLWNWINISNELHANLSINLDMLSGVMGVVVLNISALVHLYSLGYMSDDEQQEKFMSYLSLFTFFMLLLIFADNFLQLFIGWEGVGLCSYLLIGFWYQKSTANKAAIKAFIVNRVGDVGLIIAMGLILIVFKSIEFSTVLDHEKIEIIKLQKICCWNAIDIICICLFVGCMGKSAQLFLHVWLPDAMEGPTPVSALIHAATMVTAGVFLVVRCSHLFEQSAFTLQIITIVGALTAIFAATIALVQNDIKRIIAYSTCSQLGYMFFACGVSAYSQSIFHLFTHAFFKALLFLSAGSVIHGINGEQDIHKMGGLRKYMPITYIMMLIGSLALSGMYPFAGYFSKDSIIESAYMSGTIYGDFAYYVGLIVAFLTAFYSWRLVIVVFEKKNHTSSHKAHEPGPLMIIPLIILSMGAVFSGIIGKHIGMIDSSLAFWKGSIALAKVVVDQHFNHVNDNIVLEFLPMILGTLGIAFAYAIYCIKGDLPQIIKKGFIYVHHMLTKAYYFDCLYHYLFVRTTQFIASFCFKIFDKTIIDSISGVLCTIVQMVGFILKLVHTGNVRHYILMFFSFISLCFYQLTFNKLSYEFWIIAFTSMIIYLLIIVNSSKDKCIKTD
jgi:NADH-quinone oxidoreductase subunit L